MKKKIIKLLKKVPFLIDFKFFIGRFLKPKFLYFFLNPIKPISQIYGMERGAPIDRFYIEKFLEENMASIKGMCLEILDRKYTLKYGGEKVLKPDVLDIDINNQKANIHGDLRDLKNIIPDGKYDCIILTQVLQFIDNYDAALLECKRILKPGGSLLITAPAISRIDCMSGVNGDYWRFTEAPLGYILKNKFSSVEISSFGNVKTGAAFWFGLSQQDINRKSYLSDDKNFPILVTAVVKK